MSFRCVVIHRVGSPCSLAVFCNGCPRWLAKKSSLDVVITRLRKFVFGVPKSRKIVLHVCMSDSYEAFSSFFPPPSSASEGYNRVHYGLRMRPGKRARRRPPHRLHEMQQSLRSAASAGWADQAAAAAPCPCRRPIRRRHGVGALAAVARAAEAPPQAYVRIYIYIYIYHFQYVSV